MLYHLKHVQSIRFEIRKFNADFELQETYHMIMDALRDIKVCSCPARAPICRHIKMFPYFQTEQYIKEVKMNPNCVVFLKYDPKQLCPTLVLGASND